MSVCPSVTRDDARPDIFRHLTKATLYRYDYNNSEITCLDLHSYFQGKEFKIKVLNDNGADICLEGSPFISDIKFTPTQRDLLKRIEDEERKLANRRLRTINYDAEENWTLTFQLRGFKVDFDQSEPKFTLKSYITKLIYFILKKRLDYTSNTSPNHSESEYYQQYQLKKKSKTFRSVNFETLTQHLKELESNLLYIEYVTNKSPPRSPIQVSKRRCKSSTILEFWTKKCVGSDEKVILGVLIELSAYTSPDVTDYHLHSDEGAYDTGINKYEGGIALIGEQNSGVMYYGNAVEDGDVVIPDYFRDHNNNQPTHKANRYNRRQIRLAYRS